MARMGKVSALIGGTAFGQLIGLAVYPLLTRLYEPADLGTLAIYTSALGIVAVVASFRYEQAIPLPTKDSDAAGLFLLAVSIAAVVSALTAVVVWLWPGIVGGDLAPQDSLVVRVALPIGVLLLAIYQALSMMAMRSGMYRRVGATRAAQGTVAGVVQVGGGLIGMGPLGLVLGHVLGQSSGSVSLGSALRKTNLGHAWKSRSMVRMARRYVRFASIGMPSALLNTMALLLPVMLIARSFSLEEAGFFSLAVLVLSAPVQLIGRSNAQVFFAEASRAWADGAKPVRLMLSRITRRLLFVSIVPAVVLMALAPSLFPFVFGPGWHSSGAMVSILTPAYLMAVVSAPASQVFLVTERQEVSLLLNVVKLVVAIASFVLVPALGQTLTFSVWCFSAGMFVYYSLVLLLAYLALRQSRDHRRSPR